MTKTLTEQWREGTLPDDTYYWKVCKENWIADKYEMYDYTKVCDVNKIECLAPVPKYNEYNKLRKLPLKCFQLEEDNSALMVINKDMCKEIERIEKQLAIAKKALKRIDPPNIIFDDYRNSGIDLWEIAHNALKEMEGVK